MNLFGPFKVKDIADIFLNFLNIVVFVESKTDPLSDNKRHLSLPFTKRHYYGELSTFVQDCTSVKKKIHPYSYTVGGNGMFVSVQFVLIL